MESAPREVSVLKRVKEKDYSVSICSSRCPFQRGRSVCYDVMPISSHNQSLTKIFKRCYNRLWKNVKWIIAGSEKFFSANMQKIKKKKEFDHLKAQRNSELSGAQSKDLKCLYNMHSDLHKGEK